MATSDIQCSEAERRIAASPTIFALSTGAPPTAIAVVRISGDAAFGTIEQLTGRAPPPPRMLVPRTLHDPASGDVIDHAMVVVFAAPASATGDDLAELHVHGGVAVVAAVLTLLARCGLSPAAPGAFTRRAFDNGKVDLSQVEALGDLIAAETDVQRQAALARTGTRLAERVGAWRDSLVAIRADVEATLDFAEDEGVGVGLSEADRSSLSMLMLQFASAIADAAVYGRVRDGVTVAIVGPVNAGKSTLFNAFARRDAAMISPIPGTTRDTIEVRIVLSGVPVLLVDTAGSRDTADVLEIEGIRRGRRRAEVADIVIAVGVTMPNTIQVVSKSDLDEEGAGWRDNVLYLSALTGAGMDLLSDHLGERITSMIRTEAPPLVTSAWQVAALHEATAALMLARHDEDVAVVAEELRRATAAIYRLIGRVSNDEILDVVFARFCIGK